VPLIVITVSGTGISSWFRYIVLVPEHEVVGSEGRAVAPLIPRRRHGDMIAAFLSAVPEEL